MASLHREGEMCLISELTPLEGPKIVSKERSWNRLHSAHCFHVLRLPHHIHHFTCLPCVTFNVLKVRAAWSRPRSPATLKPWKCAFANLAPGRDELRCSHLIGTDVREPAPSRLPWTPPPVAPVDILLRPAE